MTDHRDWTGKVGGVWAREWRRTDRSFARLTPVLLDETRVGDFSAALDIGCGAGEVSCALARAYPAGEVIGVDISPELLAVARERGGGIVNLAFAHGDAAGWDHERGHRPELLVSRHGVMFFADPPAAFAHLREQAAPGARLRFSCFRSREENTWVGATMSALPALPPLPDPHEPGPFAFAERGRVESILAAGGWRDIAFEPVDYAMVFGAGPHPVADACDYLTRVGPTSSAIAALDEDERTATLDRLRPILERAIVEGQVAFPAAAWIVTACAS